MTKIATKEVGYTSKNRNKNKESHPDNLGSKLELAGDKDMPNGPEVNKGREKKQKVA